MKPKILLIIRDYILTALFGYIIVSIMSCSHPMQLYDVGLLVPQTVEIEFKTEKEAIRVQNRLEKHCSKPYREHNILLLEKEHLQCKRKILRKNYGFIREKYRNQINKQLR